MSAATVEPVTAKAEENPFRFGWRYVKRTLPDGEIIFDTVPLTLEDALHPQEEDRYMVNDPHTCDLDYIKYVFESRLAGIPGAIVLKDCRVAWTADGKFAHGPDVAVIFNVEARKPWSTFNVVVEGTRPALIVEITSPSTRENDVDKKVIQYAEAGVTRYIIVDADEENGERSISFVHYQLSAGDDRYVEIPVSANGRVWLPEVRLWLGAAAGQVVCYDERGNPIADYVELTVARAEADHRAEVEKQRADAAEQAIAVEVETRMADSSARRDAERRAAEAEQKLANLQKTLDESIRQGDNNPS